MLLREKIPPRNAGNIGSLPLGSIMPVEQTGTLRGVPKYGDFGTELKTELRPKKASLTGKTSGPRKAKREACKMPLRNFPAMKQVKRT